MASPSSSIGSISLDVGHRNQSMTTVTATASAIATASNTKQAKMADLEEFQKQTRSLALKVEEILGAVRVDASQVREALAQHMIEAKRRVSNSSKGATQADQPRHLLELRVDDQMLEQQQGSPAASGRLNDNIRAAFESGWLLVGAAADKRKGRSKRSDSAELSSSGSSSDSGVSLAGCGSSASSSSSLSGSATDDGCTSCKLASAYHDHLSPFGQRHEEPPRAERLDEPGYLRREHLEFGQCALDWYKLSHDQYHKNRLVALISAGMTTGSDKKYVTDTVCTLAKLGYEVCVFIRRGVGGLQLSSDKFFSPAKWRDFEAAVLSVRRQRPNARLVAVGFSFGSIELCRYLSMSGARSQVHAALLISCPFDPEAGGRNMRKRSLNRKIDAYLAKNLGKQLHQALQGSNRQMQHENYNGSLVDLAELPKVRSLVDFENNYNRALQNYPNTAAYAADSRLQGHLARIKTPTLCLSSEDDFMAPVGLLPLDQIRANENLCMVLTKCGGHMAFIDGLLWPKQPYFAQRIIAAYMGAVKEAANQLTLGEPVELERHITRHHLIQMLKEEPK